MPTRAEVASTRNTLSRLLGQDRPGETCEEKSLRIFLDRERPTPFPELERLAAHWRTLQGLPTPNLPWSSIFCPYPRTAHTAHTFARHRSVPNHPRVRAAYDELARQSVGQFELLESLGLKVDFVSEPEPYNTAQEQADDVEQNAHLSIATIACWPDAYHPILGNERGGTYDIFRAVHDTFGHVAIGTGFDRHGEFAAWLHHSSMFHGLGQLAASTELHGENSVLAATGTPAAHKATILPRHITSIPFNHRPFMGHR